MTAGTGGLRALCAEIRGTLLRRRGERAGSHAVLPARQAATQADSEAAGLLQEARDSEREARALYRAALAVGGADSGSAVLILAGSVIHSRPQPRSLAGRTLRTPDGDVEHREVTS